MSICINTFDPKYQHLKSIIDNESSQFLNSYALYFLQNKNRLPRLDEIPGATSIDYLKKILNAKQIDKNAYISQNEDILKYTNKDNIQDAIHSINNYLHPDLEVDIVDCGKTSIVTANQRPNSNNVITDPIDIETDVSKSKNKIVLTNMLYKLGKLYGINFIPITTEELQQKKWDSIIPNSGYVNAFIYEGNIYINIDNASIDAPIHELSHIFIGALRFINPTLYLQMISSVEQLPMYQKLIHQFPDRSRNDINEEIFVTETAKYLAGQKSYINSLPDNYIDEIMYNMQRVLDSMLFGQISVKNIPQYDVIHSSLLKLGREVQSTKFNNDTIIGADFAYINRTLNNIKADLLRDNKLIEECQ